MENNAQSFRNRICTDISQNKIISQKEIEIEEINNILQKCKSAIPEKEKYIVTPYMENDHNPANLTPMEEYEIIKLFKKNKDSLYCSKVTILSENEKIILQWHNRNCVDKTQTEKIEISFEENPNINDIEKEKD